MARPALVALLIGCLGSPVGAQSAPPAPPASPAPPPSPTPPRVIVVRMVERVPYGIAFEPARVRAQAGDTVRFVQAGGLPHNVEFRSIPAAADLGERRVGPMLVSVGQTYDVVIDRRFLPGKYVYVCTPHEGFGMAGIIYVQEPQAPL
jgi:plastocyanin